MTRRLLAGLAVATLLAGCSSGDSDGGTQRAGDQQAPRPDAGRDAAGRDASAQAPDGLGPIDPPAGFTMVTGQGFTVFAPETFTTEQRRSSNGEPMLVLTGPGPATGDDQAMVGVVREVNPSAGALEQSDTLESAKRLVDQATDVRRTVVAWPGAREAVLVEWTVQERMAGPAPRMQAVRTVQLFADVDDRLGLTVVAVAPADSFEASQVLTVLRTFRPAKATS